jgi:protein-S-isoprenylcysteine O-methyltransferase Ste14
MHLLKTLQSGIEQQNIMFTIANAVVVVCTSIVFLAILIDFVRYHQPHKNKKKTTSKVETGTMFLFFLIYYLLLCLKPGKLDISSNSLCFVFLFIGSILIICGCYVNVKGRIILKHNWANQATIYHNQTMVSNSVYKYVRHPLYASLIWMLIGGSFIYLHYLAFLSVIFIFIPMMYYRARQEEQLLLSEFPEYLKYTQQVGMFFPKIHSNGKL